MNKLIFIFVSSAVSVGLLLFAGCEPKYSASSRTTAGAISESEAFKAYQPVKAAFLPLSDIQPSDNTTEPDTITLYIALKDGAGSAVKAPAVFRFELYEFRPLSTDPKGKRIHIWDDIYLTDFSENNRYWRDYLRAYEFKLQYYCPDCKNYVLEVTCMTPAGTRLLATTTLDKK